MNCYKEKLHKAINTYGLNSVEALNASQELDIYIVKEQKALLKQKEKMKRN